MARKPSAKRSVLQIEEAGSVSRNFGKSHQGCGTNSGERSQSALPVLNMLLKAESSERDVRSIQYQLKVAKFPAYRDLTGFDFLQSMVDEALVKSLHRCQFLEDAQNVVLVGGPGTGM